MKILHVIPYFSRMYGGTVRVVSDIGHDFNQDHETIVNDGTI
jgi:hypothetical protein